MVVTRHGVILYSKSPSHADPLDVQTLRGSGACVWLACRSVSVSSIWRTGPGRQRYLASHCTSRVQECRCIRYRRTHSAWRGCMVPTVGRGSDAHAARVDRAAAELEVQQLTLSLAYSPRVTSCGEAVAVGRSSRTRPDSKRASEPSLHFRASECISLSSACSSRPAGILSSWDWDWAGFQVCERLLVQLSARCSTVVLHRLRSWTLSNYSRPRPQFAPL